MIRMLICCAGGFSSSAMAEKAKKEIIEKHMEDKISIDFAPFSMAARELGDYDLMMVCPHQKYQIKRYNDEYVKDQIPIYLIPPRLYGTMAIEEVYQDAVDILEIFKKNPHNPCHFPGEESVLRIKRDVAYAHFKK